MSQPTVAEHKQAFLRRQKHILAKGIAPSRKLLEIAEQAGIQEKILGDVMNKVNRDIKRHGRLVHSKQMTDHVVEQIDLLYWEAGATSVDMNEGDETSAQDSDVLKQGDDLTLDKNIAKLPATWNPSANPPSTADEQEDEEPPTQDSYMEAAARLQDLSAQRLLLQQKLNTYQTLMSLLEPYRNPQENVQPNLINKDAPLTTELNKTRTLAIRVAGRVGEKYGQEILETPPDEDDEMELDDGKARVENVLSTW